jgi:hypothetical protein
VCIHLWIKNLDSIKMHGTNVKKIINMSLYVCNYTVNIIKKWGHVLNTFGVFTLIFISCKLNLKAHARQTGPKRRHTNRGVWSLSRNRVIGYVSYVIFITGSTIGEVQFEPRKGQGILTFSEHPQTTTVPPTNFVFSKDRSSFPVDKETWSQLFTAT